MTRSLIVNALIVIGLIAVGLFLYHHVFGK